MAPYHQAAAAQEGSTTRRQNFLRSPSLQPKGFGRRTDCVVGGALNYNRPLGLSLIETVISTFILLIGGLACLELIATATRHQASSSLEIQAAQLAEQAMGRIRVWAQDPANYRAGWSLYDNDHFGSPAAPGFDIAITSESLKVVSFCTELEAKFGTEARTLDQAMRQVRVAVRWNGNREVVLVSKIGSPLAPVRTANPIVIQRLSGPLDPIPVDASVLFACDLYDTDGRAIPGVAFGWNVESISGNGYLEPVRKSAGQQVNLFHHFYATDPELNLPPHAIPGQIRLHVESVYGGAVYSGDSSVIELAP